jgi:hypothetical protein
MISAITPNSSLPRDPSKQLVLFYRDFRRFTGGHLKVWDYFNHVASSPEHEPRIAFSRESKWDSSNPWSGLSNYVTEWKPGAADILFLAGNDWRALDQSERQHFRRPIINLIQHQRHADAKSELRSFLKNRACRICVSDAVADAIKATEEVNGPVFVIPNAIDLASLPLGKSYEDRSIDVLICGLKAPELAQKAEAAATSDKRVECLTNWIPRAEYLAHLANAKITILLPRPIEGFYLPALEAMACGTIVVCPDCSGNRDFCRDTWNCFRPRYDLDEIIAALFKATQQPRTERVGMQKNAKATTLRHSLENERVNFLRILARVGELW